ncbi:hypothetical protein ACF1AB_31780 [Streptomyces sp. NPDC014846]|uniref:hypothetical protein n=1 Tax=Streptomyces sp. NPDC014846 TaxID=3364922 RepID=UPI0037002B09
MSDAFPARLPAKAQDVLTELPNHARQIVRDVLDIAGRAPSAFPPFDSRDPEGEDVRSASVGRLTAVYWINRPAGRLYVLGHVWLG